MFCRNCGTYLPEDSVFCSECGTATLFEEELAKTSSADMGTPQQAAVASLASESPAYTLQPKKKDAGSKKAIIITAASCLVALAITLTVFIVLPKANASQTATIPIGINVTTITHTSSPIPLHVKGTDSDGNAVDTVVNADPESRTFHLKEGSYTISCAGPVINENGSICRVADKTETHVEVKSKNETPFSKEYDVTIGNGSANELSVSFEDVPADKVTKQDIEDVRTLVNNSENETDSKRTSEMLTALEKSLEEKYHVEADMFAFDIPEYWRGKVRWDITKDKPDQMIFGDNPLLVNVKIYALPNKTAGLTMEQELCSIYTTVEAHPAGTVDRYTMPCENVDYKGIVTQLAVVAWTTGMSPSEPGLSYLVDLQTGGKGKVPTGYYQVAEGSFEAQQVFLRNNLMNTVKPQITETEAYDLKKAYYHVSTDYYEFDIPESWWGEVRWSTSSNLKSAYGTTDTRTEVYFYDESKKYSLLHVDSYTVTASTVPDVWAGDMSYIGLKQYDQNGRRTRVTPANYAALLKYTAKNRTLTSAELKAARLVTNGKVSSSSEFERYDETALRNFTTAFHEETLLPTFKLKY